MDAPGSSNTGKHAYHLRQARPQGFNTQQEVESINESDEHESDDHGSDYVLSEHESDEDTPPAKRRKGISKPSMSELLYCGKLAIGEQGSGVKPAITDISWNENNDLHPSFNGIDEIIACTGSFGIYLFCHSKSNAAVKDLEENWSKIQLSDSPSKLCQWAPRNFGRFLAVGAESSNGRGVIHLYDCADARYGLSKHVESFKFHVSYGMNSLSWNSKGKYLLVTTNGANTVVVIKRKSKFTLDTYPQIIKCSYMKAPHPPKADIFGVFLPPPPLSFLIVTSSGVISIYTLNVRVKTEAVGKEWENCGNRLTDQGFCGVTVNATGKLLICPRVDGSVSCIGINYEDTLQKHRAKFEDLYKLHPTPAPHVCVKWISKRACLAVVDKKQMITVYRGGSGTASELQQLLPACDNRKDIDCNKNQHALHVRADGLLTLGGEDGILNFWYLDLQKNPVPFAVKRRDLISEKLVYSKNKLQYGCGEAVQKGLLELANSAGATIKLLEEKVKAMDSLASEGLAKIYQGAELTQNEMKTILEGIRELAYGE